MYVVELDQSKRLLVITAARRVTAEQARQAAQQVRELLQDVAPGFRLLADYRCLESMDSATARHVAEIMDALAQKQVASVTRVIPDPHKDIGLNILSQFLKFEFRRSRRWLMRCKASWRDEVEASPRIGNLLPSRLRPT